MKHTCNIVLVALLVMRGKSCVRWCEAKEVVSEADSLLGEGEI